MSNNFSLSVDSFTQDRYGLYHIGDDSLCRGEYYSPHAVDRVVCREEENIEKPIESTKLSTREPR